MKEQNSNIRMAQCYNSTQNTEARRALYVEIQPLGRDRYFNPRKFVGIAVQMVLGKWVMNIAIE